MNLIRFTICFLALAFVCVTGCATKSIPDPLAGWQVELLADPNEIITKDYQDYIKQLPENERNYTGPVFYFGDGTGQHAIAFEVALNGSDWRHVLIYDKSNRRIQTIKYFSGHYRC